MNFKYNLDWTAAGNSTQIEMDSILNAMIY